MIVFALSEHWASPLCAKSGYCGELRYPLAISHSSCTRNVINPMIVSTGDFRKVIDPMIV